MNFADYSQAPHLAPQFSYLKSNTDKLRAYITLNHGSVGSVYKSGQYPSNSLLYRQMLDEDKKKKEQDEEKVKTLAKERRKKSTRFAFRRHKQGRRCFKKY